MSRIVEKGRENSKLQRKNHNNNNNKVTEVNNRRGGNDRERTLSEGNKPEDISKTFPNFSALTESERLIFFEALTTAQKNVEQRGVPTRTNFGTVHDEYLEHFKREQKEGRKGFRNEKETSYLTSRDNSASSCNDKSTLKFKPRTFSDGRTRTPSSKTRMTSGKNSAKVLTKESGLGDHCEAMIDKNTKKMIDLYLKKKERNKAKPKFNVPVANEKPVKCAGTKPPRSGGKRNVEPGKKPAKTSQAGTVPGKALKVRNTAKFDALNAEEKEIFFRTLKKAHDNIIEKNPEKEILPLSAIMKRYEADDRRVKALHTASKEPQRSNDRERNLRVRLTLTSGDNERLSKTEYHSGPAKEFCDRRHKSADSLLVKGSQPKRTHVICDQSDQTDSSLNDSLMASKDSLEIHKRNLSKLNSNNLTTFKQRQSKIVQPKHILKWEKKEEKEEKPCETCLKPHAREKRKAKRKMAVNPKRLKTGPATVSGEPKNMNVLKKILNKPLLGEKKKIIKDVEVQAKKRLKSKIQKLKKAQEKKKFQKKEEHSVPNVAYELQIVRDRQSMKESNGSDLTEEQSKEDSKDCESEWQTTSAEVQCSEESGDGTSWKVESRQSEKAVNEEECVMPCERGEETETALEEKEEKPFEMVSGSPRDVSADEELAPLSSDLNGREESTVAMKGRLFLVDDNACEPEGMKKETETSRENPEPLAVETRKEIVADAVVLQEAYEGVSFPDGKTREGEKTEEIVPCLASGKMVFVDDDLIEKIKKLICYLEAKIQENDHSEQEYFQLLVDYVDYLTKVLESLVLREEQQRKKQVQERSTATEVHLRFDVTGAQRHKAESAPILEKNSIPRSVRDSYSRRAHSETAIAETKGENPNEKQSKRKSDEKMQEAVDSESCSDSEGENQGFSFTLNDDISDKNVLRSNVQLFKVLLQQRAEFGEDSVADLTTVHHPDAEDFAPERKPPTLEFLGEEGEDDKQRAHKRKFFKVLLKYFSCGSKKLRKIR